ncbi:uncharacterized protein K444DRAFT_608881 [Hyaloscypha bicolor E]|uniref:Heterokaryon incompatibility domain-containing protein n=1 Tax=Hyaloscypha bicolor E TaxID=1095630 RepID=A0A2J6TQA2_9HELO|nr:uncharacterized protein K444DRAFT_608881 [Hyaloscypha bicolor E]PMD65191.1 hypothetical protein K444DRAFT_608881 [Hyaloscypha bicolor E]
MQSLLLKQNPSRILEADQMAHNFQKDVQGQNSPMTGTAGEAPDIANQNAIRLSQCSTVPQLTAELFPVFTNARSRTGERAKMKNDIYKTFGDIYDDNPARLTHDIIEIAKHTVSQESMHAWASNLRFLTAGPPSNSSSALAGEASNAIPCACEDWPAFEADHHYTKLHLTAYGQLNTCPHYVAVSYCWQHASSSSEVKDGPYPVSTTRGVRPGRAPGDVVKRAVNFAASRGVKFIWIDQECIEQDDREDKELGVQSMDLVYQRSFYPLGLFEVKIERQNQMDAMAQAIGRRNREGDEKGVGQRLDVFFENQEPVTEEELRSLTEVFELLATDRWLRRAWILQETVLAGHRMTFMIRSNSGITIRSPINPSGIKGEICLSIFDLKGLDGAGTVYSGLEFTISDETNGSHTILSSLVRIAKVVTPRLVVGWRLWDAYSHANNAIGAIVLLETYMNSRIPDRLAIIANLCNYRKRLSTTALDELEFDFSVCLLTLALLNGDFSILRLWHEISHNIEFPAFKWKRQSDPPTLKLLNSDQHWKAFSWAPSPTARIAPPDVYLFKDEFSLRLRLFSDPALRLSEAKIRTTGLQFMGWLWTTDNIIDFEDLMSYYINSFINAVDDAPDLNSGFMRWTEGAGFMWKFFQALVQLKLYDLAELIWSQAVVDHLHVETSSNKNASNEAPVKKFHLKGLKFEGGRPLLSDMFDYDSGFYIGYESCWHLSILDFIAIMRTLLRRELEWNWIIPEIIATGSLWYGTLETSSDTCSRAIGVFEPIDKGHVLTPVLNTDMRADITNMFLKSYRPRPHSWGVERIGDDGDGSVLCHGNGMIRGIYKTYGEKSQRYTLD